MKIEKRVMYMQSFEAATQFAREMALLGRKNKVQRGQNSPLWYMECECTNEDFNAVYERIFDEPYEVEDPYDYDDYVYYSCSSHHSILDGGFDEPTEDEWERSGLL